MPILIGTDEAGYGPNLGPLLITATAWELPEDILPDSLWKLFDRVLTNAPSRGDQRLHVADSKQVYSGGKSMATLERSVQAFLRHLEYPTSDVLSLCRSVSDDRFCEDYAEICRGLIDEMALPVVAGDFDCQRDAVAISDLFDESGVRLLSIQSRVIFPPEFNAGVEATGSKGKILSAATLELVRDAVERTSEQSGWIYCDKHGGRNRYDDIISDAFPDRFVFRLEESGPKSRYKVGDMEFCFRTKAEELLPVALASMVAKYVREIVMLQFNRFWQHHLPNLKATKGYPLDAKRFWEDIATTAAKLGIHKHEIWRCR